VCKIDTTIWHIYKWEANEWPGYAKLSEYDLKWEGGAIVEGFKKADGKLTIAPMFQVKAWMVRKEPAEVKPVIKPVSVCVSIPPTSRREGQRVKRVPVVPDAQIGFKRDYRTGALDPFHDREALDVALQIVQDGVWDGLAFLGDWSDWTMWTDKFAREPGFYYTTQPAVLEAAWWLLQFRLASPCVPAWMVDSNHEARLEDYLNAHVLDAYGLKPGLGYDVHPSLSIPRLFGLDDLCIEWVSGYPDAEVNLCDELRIEHGNVARGKPGSTAAAVVDNSPGSVIFGHIHRREMATRTEYRRGRVRTITAMCPGCLCRLDGVVPGHNRTHDWQQGMAIANYTEDGYVHLEQISIEGGRAFYDGKMYQARERIEDIRRDVDWKL
jgi:hypothetical protein